MLKNSNLIVTIPVEDIQRARNFYEQKLGLDSAQQTDGGLYYQLENSTKLYLYERKPFKCEHTIASFIVDDVEDTMKNLEEKGVVFEEYDTDEIKTVNKIATKGNSKIAWFKDSEDNILAISQMK